MGTHAVDEIDRILMARLIRGDEEAFGQFFDLVFEPLDARVQTHGGSAEWREQAVRAAMSDGVRNLDKWRGQAPIIAWLTAILENQRISTRDGGGVSAGLSGAPIEPDGRERVRAAVHAEWQEVTTRRAQKRVLTSAVFGVILALVIMLLNCPPV